MDFDTRLLSLKPWQKKGLRVCFVKVGALIQKYGTKKEMPFKADMVAPIICV